MLIRIEPGRIRQGLGKEQLVAWEQEFEDAIRQGLRAALRTSSLVTGAMFVDLNFYPDQARVGFGQLAEYKTLPTISGGLARIEQQVVSLLNKLNQLQVEPVLANAQNMLKESELTLQEVRKLTSSLDKLAARSDTQRLPAELRQTLVDLQQTLKSLSTNSPAYARITSYNVCYTKLLRYQRLRSHRPAGTARGLRLARAGVRADQRSGRRRHDPGAPAEP